MTLFKQKDVDDFNTKCKGSFNIKCKESINKPLYFLYKDEEFKEINEKIIKNCENKNCEIIEISDNICERLGTFYYLIEILKNMNENKEGIYDYILIYMNNKFCGFLITEYNECKNKKRPGDSRTQIDTSKHWSVKLICSKCPKSGSTMIGTYLNSLLNIKQDIAFLELSNLYENLSGFCLYSKFGFVEKHDFVCDEYDSYGNGLSNLKMICNMSQLDQNKLIDIVNGKLKLSDHPLCNKSEKNADIYSETYLNKVKALRQKEIDEYVKSGYNMETVKPFENFIIMEEDLEKFFKTISFGKRSNKHRRKKQQRKRNNKRRNSKRNKK